VTDEVKALVRLALTTISTTRSGAAVGMCAWLVFVQGSLPEPTSMTPDS
jgi:hypothetical protein